MEGKRRHGGPAIWVPRNIRESAWCNFWSVPWVQNWQRTMWCRVSVVIDRWKNVAWLARWLHFFWSALWSLNICTKELCKLSRAIPASYAVYRVLSLFCRVDTDGQTFGRTTRCGAALHFVQNSKTQSTQLMCRVLDYKIFRYILQLETTATPFTYLAKLREHCYDFLIIFTLFSKHNHSCSWLSVGCLEQKHTILEDVVHVLSRLSLVCRHTARFKWTAS